MILSRKQLFRESLLVPLMRVPFYAGHNNWGINCYQNCWWMDASGTDNNV